jgi:hypothetical protein
MKLTEEIYCVLFNKIITQEGLKSDTYVLGRPSPLLEIPKSIVLKGNHIVITFESNTKHVIKDSENVELFYRPIEKKNGTTIKDKPIKKRVRRRANPV